MSDHTPTPTPAAPACQPDGVRSIDVVSLQGIRVEVDGMAFRQQPLEARVQVINRVLKELRALRASCTALELMEIVDTGRDWNLQPTLATYQTLLSRCKIGTGGN